MVKKYLLAHDVGTSGDKAVLADIQGHIVCSVFKKYDVLFPETNAAEQDPDELWNAVVWTTRDLLQKAGIDKKQIAGIGVSAQAFNLLPVDENVEPLMDMIGWMDLRCIDQAEAIPNVIDMNHLYRWTYNFPRSKDVIPKILWLREERPRIWERTRWLINCKEYIIHKLTGKLAMDWHSASIFFLLDPHTMQWSQKACNALGIPIDRLAEIYPCNEVIGGVTKDAADMMGLLSGTPVILCPADIAAAQVGCGAINEGYTSVSLGTGGWVCVTSENLINDPKYPFWALAHSMPKQWIIGAGLDTGGSSLLWLRDGMFEGDYREARNRGQNAYTQMLKEAQNVKPGADGLFFIPWVYGERGHLGIDHYARGAFIGLSSNHKKAHMIRAVLEGVTYQFKWMIEALEDIGLDLDALIMIGGGSTNRFWTQIMSDILGRELHIPEKPQEVGSIGVIHTSASALGIHPNLRSVESLLRFEKMVRPTEGKLRNKYEVNYQEYRKICDDLIATYRRMYQIERGMLDAEGME